MNAPHECTPSMEELNNIKNNLLSNKNRTKEEQKKFEAISLQTENIDRYNLYLSEKK